VTTLNSAQSLLTARSKSDWCIVLQKKKVNLLLTSKIFPHFGYHVTGTLHDDPTVDVFNLRERLS